MGKSNVKANSDGEIVAGGMNAKTISEYVSEVSDRRTQILRAADEVCADLAIGLTVEQLNAGRFPLNPDERNLFAALGWDADKIRKNIGRMRAVREDQKTAGTKSERTASAERLAAAQKALLDNADNLRSQIEQLQQQLTTLESNVKTAESAVSKRQAAVLRLRERVPDDVRSNFDASRRSLNEAYHDEMAVVERAIHLNRNGNTAAPPADLADELRRLKAAKAAEREELETKYLDIYLPQ